MSVLHVDFESRSAVDLRKSGVYRYAQDPSTDLWCMAYAFDDEPVELWEPSQVFPLCVIDHVAKGGELAAWNSSFERIMWQEILHKRYGRSNPKPEQWRCVMAESFAMAFPGKLEHAAPALGLDIRKDDAGHRLMLQMAKPRRTNPDGTHVWWDDEERRQRLYAYCKQDVEVERQIEKRLLRLRPLERKIFLLDAKINDRGVMIDTRACRAAKQIVAQTTERLDAEMKKVTKREVQACSNVKQLVAWLEKKGLPIESVRKEQVNELLAMEIPDDAKRALELRRDASKTSTAKLTSMLERVDADGRMRGNLQYHGAATGRWAARGAQLQNIPRGTRKIGDSEVADLFHGADVVELLHGSPMQFVSDSVRAMIRASPGRTLMSADFSNIEGRVLAWLAGQEDALEAFRLFDAGRGPDVYKVTAAGIFGKSVDQVSADERQVGKVACLALGYEGGVMAFQAMAGNYGLKIGRYYDMIWPAMREEHREITLKGWSSRGRKSGVEQRSWLAAEVVKVAWRAKNPKIRAYWKTLNESALEAVRNPGVTIDAGRVRFRKNGSFLFAQLPSGRLLTYPYPRLENKKLPWTDDEGNDCYAEAIVFKGVDSFTKKWSDQDFYGGLSSENLSQGVARDLMAEAMLRVEEAGYPVVLTVHDEIVAEPKTGHGSIAEFCALMSETPAWAKGCPVAAAGWTGTRYKKA